MKWRNTNYALGLLMLGGLFYLFILGQRVPDRVNAETALLPPPTPTPGPLAQENIELVGHLGGLMQAVATQGDYAYLGAGSALSVLDITDPAQPQRIGHLVLANERLPLSTINDIALAGNYAYLAEDEGLRIINITDPTNPVEVGRFKHQLNYGVTNRIAVFGNYAYLGAGQSGVRIIDITDPTTPVEISFFNTQSYVLNVAATGDYLYVVDGLGLYVVNVSNPQIPVRVGFYNDPTTVIDLAIQGDYAYLAAGSDGLRVVDISTPTNPTEVGRLNDNDHVGFLTIANNTVVYLSVNIGKLQRVDVTNPANPLKTGSLTQPEFSYNGYCCGYPPPMNLVIKDNHIFIPTHAMGLSIVDLTPPTGPALTTTYHPLVSPRDVAMINDIAYVADKEGLKVVDATDPTNPTIINRFDTSAPLKQLEIEGNRAYLATTANRVIIVDLTSPTTPITIGTYITSDPIKNIEVTPPYLFLATGYNRLNILDMTDPTQPIELSTYANQEPFQFVANQNYAYLADRFGLSILDITDPANPVVVNQILDINETTELLIDENLLYLISDNRQLNIFDISDPVMVDMVGSLELQSDNINQLVIEGTHLYLSHGYYYDPAIDRSESAESNLKYIESGLSIVDVSDPTVPLNGGFFTMPGTTLGMTVSNGKIYAANPVAGLFILQRLPAIAGTIRDSQGFPVAGVTIEADSGLTTFSNWQDGRYSLNPPLPGTYTITPTLNGFNFEPPARTVTLPPDAFNQDFTIYANPVTLTLQPGLSATLIYSDTFGLLAQLDFPAGSVDQPTTINLALALANDKGRLKFGGQAFDLVAYQNGLLQPDFQFKQPVTFNVTYRYGYNPPHDLHNAGLWRWLETRRESAIESCQLTARFPYQRHRINRTISLPICHAGRYGLFTTKPLERAVTIASVRDQADDNQSLSLQKAGDLHMQVLFPLGWDSLEVGNGVYEWDQLNDILQQASYHNRQVILRIYNAPVWHTPFAAPLTHPPTDPQALYDFMFNMVSYVQQHPYSYGQQVAGYVIWNEPNIPAQWGEQPTDPAAYIALLKAAYEGAKAADPNATIISAGLAPTETGNGAINDLDYLAQLYDLGLANYTDVVGMQGLGFQHPPEHDTGSPAYNFNRLKYLYQVMVDHDDQDRPVWALEVGWLRDSPYDMGSFEPFKVSEQDQAQYLYRAWQKAENEWPWLETMVFWNLDYDRYYPPASNFYWYSIANQLAESHLSLALPEPVHIGPNLPDSLFYSGVHLYHWYGNSVRFTFPEGAVSEPAIALLTPVKVTPPSGLTLVGPQVALEIHQNGAQNTDILFANPVEIRFEYSPPSPVTNFGELSVLWWNGTVWQPAGETCSPNTQQSHNLAEGNLTVPVCRAGVYVLVGPTQEIYMPLIHR